MICRTRGLSKGFARSKSSVRMGPDALAVTLMPWGANCNAHTLVKEIMAPLAAA